ncbi:DMT family transporter [Leptolyngbya sp. FACHB-261]|uniref:DMT family transporter n=1 Tax=Leptolyngbya sp. FACHB-261 TaxID=2692806 RepID=UPI0016848C0A|nr:DMT family transporter [Leptolyngbya sp. FACHB-261]MBD2104441.1 DMT family transporter [Leptolyngbya sp. FACHB-261]
MNKQNKSYLYLGLCILLWASIPVASKKILVELDNLQMLFYSTIFSCLIMSSLLLRQRKVTLSRKYSLRDYSVMVFLGFLGNYLYYIFLYGALALTTASEGFILAYTWPILVLVLASVILKEKMTLKRLIAIAISFLGIVLIVTRGNLLAVSFTNLTGDVMAVVGAFVFALFSVLGKKYNFDKTLSVFVYFASALFFVTLTMFAFSSFQWPSSPVFFWLLYNGFLVNGISYIFWFKALEYGDTAVISNALYLTPFLSLVYISLFLSESIAWSSILGLIVIVSGIILQSVGQSRKSASLEANRY